MPASSAVALAGGGSWHGSTELEANKPASRVAATEEVVGSCGSLMAVAGCAGLASASSNTELRCAKEIGKVDEIVKFGRALLADVVCLSPLI